MGQASAGNAGDGTEERLQKELATCVLGSSYRYCLLGVAASIPIGVKMKVPFFLQVVSRGWPHHVLTATDVLQLTAEPHSSSGPWCQWHLTGHGGR
jgi:hypothetical protein